MKNIILCFSILIASCAAAQADAITFEAAVNSPRISLDEVLQLTLTFTGVNHDLDPVHLPVLDGFSAKYLGPSTSTSITMINGSYQNHSERSFVYNLFPNKAGRFQIPPITAIVDGQTYSTQPIDVEVLQSTTQPQAPASGTPDQNQAPSAESLKDKILIIVSVQKTDVYLNERVPLTIKLLVNGVPVRDIQYPQFDKTGFMVDDFDKPEQSSQVLNGIRYDTVKFKTYIYPNRPGDLQIGPVQIAGNVLYKTGQENPFGPDNNFFGSDVFNNFFDSYATRPVRVTSQPIVLHVSALPSENRPNNFSGAIGQFDFQAAVSPLVLKAGDPITLKMDLKGSGNFKGVEMPVFQSPGFKTYEPQIKSGADEKTAEEVIIPIAADIKEVPALHFSYFDTSTNNYQTITQGPFAIQVTAPAPDQEFKAVGFTDLGHGPSILPAQRPVLEKIFNKAGHVLRKLFKSIWFWMAAGLVLAAGVSYFLWRRFQDRLESDPAFARRLRAVRQARQALVVAEEYILSGKTKEFYALLSKVLYDYLANKWHQSAAALSTDKILSHLKTVQLDEAYIAQIKAVLGKCDLVCFAGASFDSAKMRADLSQVQDLITYLEKSLK